jgi:hypothetical protein
MNREAKITLMPTVIDNLGLRNTLSEAVKYYWMKMSSLSTQVNFAEYLWVVTDRGLNYSHRRNSKYYPWPAGEFAY